MKVDLSGLRIEDRTPKFLLELLLREVAERNGKEIDRSERLRIDADSTRDEWIVWLRSEGASVKEIAEMALLTQSRIYQILNSTKE